MPRKMTREMTFEEMESEAMFMLAMVKADPNASDLESYATGWTTAIEKTRKADSEFRQREADVEAFRTVANEYLDFTCVTFGDELYLACGKNRSSYRWTKYFSSPVSSFTKQALARQVSVVRSWLSSSTDEILEKYRSDLEAWSQKSDQAPVDTVGLAVLRQDIWAKRENLANDLTRQRDVLQRKLAERADERDLGRTWPHLFFRTAYRPAKVSSSGASGSETSSNANSASSSSSD